MAPPTFNHGDLSLPLPSGWFDASQLLLAGPEENGFRPNLTITFQPVAEGITAEDYAKGFRVTLAQELTDYQVVKEGPARFGGLSGFLREQTFELEKVKVAQLQFCVVQQGLARTFTFTHRAARLESYRTFAESMLSSIQLHASHPPSGSGGSFKVSG